MTVRWQAYVLKYVDILRHHHQHSVRFTQNQLNVCAAYLQIIEIQFYRRSCNGFLSFRNAYLPLDARCYFRQFGRQQNRWRRSLHRKNQKKFFFESLRGGVCRSTIAREWPRWSSILNGTMNATDTLRRRMRLRGRPPRRASISHAGRTKSERAL